MCEHENKDDGTYRVEWDEKIGKAKGIAKDGVPKRDKDDPADQDVIIDAALNEKEDGNVKG